MDNIVRLKRYRVKILYIDKSKKVFFSTNERTKKKKNQNVVGGINFELVI